MKKLSILLFCIICSGLLFAQPCVTNFLKNPSFETPLQGALGNNFPSPYNVITGWVIPTAVAGTPVGGFNLVRVDGTVYSGGPNTAHQGNQYVDINGAGGRVEQNFTLTCPSTAITFSGWFSRREAGGSPFNSFIEIKSGAAVVATSSVVNFTSSESEENWKQVTGTVTLAAGTYTFSFAMDDYANIDDAFLCGTPGCVLPITIAAFTGVSNKCVDKLTWATSSEINSNRIEVEYSNDGIDFKTVGTVATKNILTGSSYTFNYKSEGYAKSFYRLKAIDNDGRFSYSSIIIVTTNCDAVAVNVYPNPVADIINVNIANNNSSKLIVYNTDGKMVVPITMLQNGKNTINIKNLSKGIYFVKVFGAADTKVFRVTKM